MSLEDHLHCYDTDSPLLYDGTVYRCLDCGHECTGILNLIDHVQKEHCRICRTRKEDMRTWRTCPKCGNEAFELVDVHPDLNAELEDLEHAEPAEIETWVCHHCGHEEQG